MFLLDDFGGLTTFGPKPDVAVKFIRRLTPIPQINYPPNLR